MISCSRTYLLLSKALIILSENPKNTQFCFEKKDEDYMICKLNEPDLIKFIAGVLLTTFEMRGSTNP